MTRSRAAWGIQIVVTSCYQQKAVFNIAFSDLDTSCVVSLLSKSGPRGGQAGGGK